MKTRILFASLLALVPFITKAAPVSTTLINPLGVDTIQEFFLLIIDFFLTLALPVVVLFMVYAGFRFVMARGNAGAIMKAKNQLFSAIVGAVLIFGAQVILDIIIETIKTI